MYLVYPPYMLEFELSHEDLIERCMNEWIFGFTLID